MYYMKQAETHQGLSFSNKFFKICLSLSDTVWIAYLVFMITLMIFNFPGIDLCNQQKVWISRVINFAILRQFTFCENKRKKAFQSNEMNIYFIIFFCHMSGRICAQVIPAILLKSDISWRKKNRRNSISRTMKPRLVCGHEISRIRSSL